MRILYLPDEQRTIVAHSHLCFDLSKLAQARDKAELVRIFRNAGSAF
jgi:hypothetical protein